MGGLDLKFIITLVVVVLSSVLGSAGSIYLLGPMVLVPALTASINGAGAAAAHGEGEGKDGQGAPGADGHGKAGAHAKPSLGMNLELDEFTANLKSDPDLEGSQYIRTKMALSIGVPKEEDCHAQEKKEGEGGGGGHGGGAPAADPCQTAFNEHMAPYIPAIRDVINSSLMRHTATELSMPEGQDAFKKDIQKQITQLMGGHYTVQRVNFQDFIIQK